MKTLYKIFLFVFVTGIMISCTNETVIDIDPDFELSFQRNGNTDAFAGEAFYVLPKGSGEYLTLYSGMEGNVWGDTLATGRFFSTSDSLEVTYPVAGRYLLTVVASSTENYGHKLNRKHKTVEINVVDIRNSITSFSITTSFGNYNGAIKGNDITIQVPDVITDFNFSAVFRLSSNAAKVFIGDIEQKSSESINDFSSPITYRVIADNGEETTYNVRVITFPASKENVLIKFGLAPYNSNIGYTFSNGEIAEIDEENKTINLKVNYGTTDRARLVASSSNLSNIYIQTANANNKLNTNTRYTLNSILSVQVEAQNKERAIYKLNIEDLDPVVSFTFKGLTPSPQGVIDRENKTVTINVLKGTDITQLVAEWTGTVGIVRVGSVSQVNGVTSNNFSTPVEYMFYKGSSVGVTYTIIVRVV
ncbi:MAG: hypothetical protein ACK5MK_09245 [Dysgonomonas sp.]